jgi:glycosyltransferase involved in cell wall biosynthesis
MNAIGLMEDPRQFSEVCIDAMSALATQGHSLDTARLLAYYPAINRNPFQKMLYASGFDEGFAVTPLPSLDAVDVLSDRMKITIHYHWLHGIFRRIDKAREAKKAAGRFIDQIRRQQEAGHHLLWTLHNILSHSAKFPEEEAELRQSMVDVVDHVHIMNPATKFLIGSKYAIDDSKIIQVSHPSYSGVYGDYISRAQARLELGLNEENIAFLCFGALGPHKGTRFFIRVLDDLQKRFHGRARLIIAGAKGPSDYMEKLYSMISARSDIILYADHVDDQALQVFFRASDVVVCPYAMSLNSGVAMTAATFGKPAVVPEMLAPVFGDIDQHMIGFTPDDHESCLKAANEAANAAGEHADSDGTVKVITDWSEARAPEKVSSEFFRAIRSRV